MAEWVAALDVEDIRESAESARPSRRRQRPCAWCGAVGVRFKFCSMACALAAKLAAKPLLPTRVARGRPPPVKLGRRQLSANPAVPVDDYPRPRTWGECCSIRVWCPRCERQHLRGDLPRICECGARLVWRCPWVGCRHHRYLDVSRAGSITYNFPHLQPLEIPEPCGLDLGQRGYPAIADYLGFTHQALFAFRSKMNAKLKDNDTLRAEAAARGLTGGPV